MSELLQNIILNQSDCDSYSIYTRKSLDDADNQRNSIEYQTQKCLEFAKSNNLPIAKSTAIGFCENGIIREHHSGFKEQKSFEILDDGSVKQYVDRPKFLKLIQLLQQKKLKGIIVNCWDRISRNETDDTLIKKLIKQGIDIRFVDASYDDSSAGALHMDIDGIFSRHYSRTISEKVRSASKKLRKEGRCIYSAPLGYLDKGSDNKPFDPDRAPLIKRVFERYATGEWSYGGLARWVSDQGLTTRPRRRKRTKNEMLMNLDPNTIPKVSHRISAKQIENILKNPFYMGINIHNTETDQSIAHEALISSDLFYKVQAVMRARTTTKHYPEKAHFTYRGILRCKECKRSYSPYLKKGHTYYSSRCKDSCSNKKKTMSEKDIDLLIQGVLDTIHFNDTELLQIEKDAHHRLNKITNKRDKELDDLKTRHSRVLKDLDYLTSQRITFLRNQIMTIEQIKDQEHLLKEELSEIQLKMEAYNTSTKKMLEYVVTYSNLVKNRLKNFKNFNDYQKRKTIQGIFSELLLKDGNMEYQAKQGFDKLLSRFSPLNEYSGSPNYIISELEPIYFGLKKNAISFARFQKEKIVTNSLSL